MKKFLILVLSLIMALSMITVASAEGGFSGEIKVWVAENTVEFTKTQVEAFGSSEGAQGQRHRQSQNQRKDLLHGKFLL